MALRHTINALDGSPHEHREYVIHGVGDTVMSGRRCGCTMTPILRHGP
jgi:hypothetical protein